MSASHEQFWTHESYALVGHSSVAPFPKLSYAELKKQGRRVFAVDASAPEVEGDPTYPDLDSLPEPVDAAVLEVPKEETADWVRKAADAGIHHVWIHMNRDTPEAVAAAEERNLDLHTGTCAVMYLSHGFSVHKLHGWINKAMGKY